MYKVIINIVLLLLAGINVIYFLDHWNLDSNKNILNQIVVEINRNNLAEHQINVIKNIFSLKHQHGKFNNPDSLIDYLNKDLTNLLDVSIAINLLNGDQISSDDIPIQLDYQLKTRRGISHELRKRKNLIDYFLEMCTNPTGLDKTNIVLLHLNKYCYSQSDTIKARIVLVEDGEIYKNEKSPGLQIQTYKVIEKTGSLLKVRLEKQLTSKTFEIPNDQFISICP